MAYVIGTLVLQTLFDLMFLAATPSIDNFQFENNASTINAILASELWDYFGIFAIGLTLCYFIVEINKKWAFEGSSMTLKSMFLPFMKLMIFVVCMYYLADLFSALLSFNDGFLETVEGAAGNSNNFDVKGLGEEIAKGTNFWGKLFLLVVGILGLAVSIIVQLVWVYKGLLYRVEFIIRVLFAPIACADIYSGQNSALVKYVKGTVALILYGACLVIIPPLVLAIAISDLGAATTEVGAGGNIAEYVVGLGGGNPIMVIVQAIKIIIAPIAAIGLTGTAKSLMREAMGA